MYLRLLDLKKKRRKEKKKYILCVPYQYVLLFKLQDLWSIMITLKTRKPEQVSDPSLSKYKTERDNGRKIYISALILSWLCLKWLPQTGLIDSFTKFCFLDCLENILRTWFTLKHNRKVNLPWLENSKPWLKPICPEKPTNWTRLLLFI